MSQSHFFAHLSRLKLINRWPLMRNVRTEMSPNTVCRWRWSPMRWRQLKP